VNAAISGCPIGWAREQTKRFCSHAQCSQTISVNLRISVLKHLQVAATSQSANKRWLTLSCVDKFLELRPALVQGKRWQSSGTMGSDGEN
jgi:hypothetical protein